MFYFLSAYFIFCILHDCVPYINALLRQHHDCQNLINMIWFDLNSGIHCYEWNVCHITDKLSCTCLLLKLCMFFHACVYNEAHILRNNAIFCCCFSDKLNKEYILQNDGIKLVTNCLSRYIWTLLCWASLLIIVKCGHMSAIFAHMPMYVLVQWLEYACLLGVFFCGIL